MISFTFGPDCIHLGHTFPRDCYCLVILKLHINEWHVWSMFFWIRSRNCSCLVTWFCCQLIAKPGNKAAAVSWPVTCLFLIFMIDLEYFLNLLGKLPRSYLSSKLFLPWWHNRMKTFPRYCPFVREIQWSPVNSPHKGPWRGALVFSLICTWTNGWVSNRDAGDLRRHRAHYDVTVMSLQN